MKSWILSISIVVIINTIFSIVFPNGKAGKYVVGISSFLIVLVVLSPLTNLKNNNFNIGNFEINEEISYQEDYLYFIAENNVCNNEKLCQKILNNYNLECEKVIIEFDYLGKGEVCIKKIKIYLINGDKTMSDEHINNIEQAIEKISQILYIDKEVVFVC